MAVEIIGVGFFVVFLYAFIKELIFGGENGN